MNPQLYFDNLGKPGRDLVTGFEGIIESVCFDLYGCILFMLRPVGLNKDGESRRGEWFDITRIDIEPGVEAIMPPPMFINAGQTQPNGPAIHGDTNDRRR